MIISKAVSLSSAQVHVQPASSRARRSADLAVARRERSSNPHAPRGAIISEALSSAQVHVQPASSRARRSAHLAVARRERSSTPHAPRGATQHAGRIRASTQRRQRAWQRCTPLKCERPHTCTYKQAPAITRRGGAAGAPAGGRTRAVWGCCVWGCNAARRGRGRGRGAPSSALSQCCLLPAKPRPTSPPPPSRPACGRQGPRRACSA